MGLITLKEVCSSTGISRRAIQGYEEAGLVKKPCMKNKYGHLLYDQKTVDRIKKIKLYHQLGFQIKEIKKIIDAPAYILRPALEEKVQLLQKGIELENQLMLKVQEIIKELKLGEGEENRETGGAE